MGKHSGDGKSRQQAHQAYKAQKAQKVQGTRNRLDPVSVFGEVLLTLGIIALLFAFWDVYWTNIQSGRQQSEVTRELADEWGDKNPRPLTEPTEGTAFARLSIPSFGSDFSFSVVKGVTDEDLSVGPGHYMDTQDPGQRGNFAIAGHRVGRGAPFNDLGALTTCDSVVVETAGSWLMYRVLPIDVEPADREAALEECMEQPLAQKMSEGDYANVDGRSITHPADVNVINPLPNLSRTSVEEGDEKILTMTTCHPQYSNAERMIVHAVQVREDKKKPGYTPPELTSIA